MSILRRLFRRRRAPTAVHILRGSYDAAQTTPENYRYWAAADDLTPTTSLSPAVRRTLRRRARYEVANNCYAKGLSLSVANDCIGRGPRLQILGPNPRTAAYIEDQFHAWAQATNLAEKLRSMRLARIQDGEAFAILNTNPDLPHPILLDPTPVEADAFDAPPALQPTIPDGIVKNAAGYPTGYHYQPDPSNTAAQPQILPRSHVLHWFRIERPGQTRGCPELTPALPLFAQLRRFSQAVLSAAETAATFAAILYTDLPPNGEAQASLPWDTIPLEHRAMMTIPAGWKISQLQPSQPAATHTEYTRTVLNEAARCLLVPFNVALGNSSGYNYASGRLDHQTYFKALRVDQHHCETHVLRPLLAAWLDEAALLPNFLPPDTPPLAHLKPMFFWDAPEHVDPAKEAAAAAMRLDSNTTTLAYEYARQGRDWEEALRQRAAELRLMRELGIPTNSLPTDPPNPDDPLLDEEEEP